VSLTTRSITVFAVGLFLAGPGAALTGCNLIVGSGDYVIDAGAGTPDDASSSNPPDGGGGSSSGGTGSDGATSLPEAGPIPEAGSGGDGGVPEDGGTITTDAGTVVSTVGCGAGDGLIVGPQASGTAFQQLVTACEMAVSCDPAFFDVTLSDCITDNYLGAFAATSCLATVASCDDYFACTGNTVADPSLCDGSNFDDTGSCAGAVATTCFGGGGGFKANCAVLGGTCTKYDADGDGDVAANCVKLASCPDTSDGYHCASSSYLYECDTTETGTIPIGNNCPASSSCESDDNGTHCVYDASSCTAAGSTCNGNKLVTCSANAGGNEGATYDCGSVGLSCVANGASGTAACVAPGCQSSTCVESCDGNNVITACVGGAPYNIDCTVAGFTGCSTDSPDGSSTTYAFCYY
jgi:hypothetical protein